MGDNVPRSPLLQDPAPQPGAPHPAPPLLPTQACPLLPFPALPGLRHVHLQVLALHQPAATSRCQPGRGGGCQAGAPGLPLLAHTAQALPDGGEAASVALKHVGIVEHCPTGLSPSSPPLLCWGLNPNSLWHGASKHRRRGKGLGEAAGGAAPERPVKEQMNTQV